MADKSENGYQIGRGILPDTRNVILYQVMHFILAGRDESTKSHGCVLKVE